MIYPIYPLHAVWLLFSWIELTYYLILKLLAKSRHEISSITKQLALLYLYIFNFQDSNSKLYSDFTVLQFQNGKLCSVFTDF